MFFFLLQFFTALGVVAKTLQATVDVRSYGSKFRLLHAVQVNLCSMLYALIGIIIAVGLLTSYVCSSHLLTAELSSSRRSGRLRVELHPIY